MASTLSVSHRKPAGVSPGTVIHAVSQFGPGTTVHAVGAAGDRVLVPLTADGAFEVAPGTHYVVRVGHNDDQLRHEVQRLRNKKNALKRRVAELEEMLRVGGTRKGGGGEKKKNELPEDVR
jgi:hypothetical protein